MLDKIKRIKKSRLNPEELYLIKLFDYLDVVEFDDYILYNFKDEYKYFFSKPISNRAFQYFKHTKNIYVYKDVLFILEYDYTIKTQIDRSNLIKKMIYFNYGVKINDVNGTI